MVLSLLTTSLWNARPTQHHSCTLGLHVNENFTFVSALLAAIFLLQKKITPNVLNLFCSEAFLMEIMLYGQFIPLQDLILHKHVYSSETT